jgi:hypothetical protein
MSSKTPVPKELQHLLEKRDGEDRRKRASQVNLANEKRRTPRRKTGKKKS